MSLENNDPNSLPSVSLSSEMDFSVEQVELMLQSQKVHNESDDQNSTSSMVSKELTSATATPSIQRNRVSGLYSITTNSWKLDLRIDIDGHRPMRMVSGDYYNINGRTTTYFG